MRQFLLATSFAVALPLAAFAQTATGGAMSGPTTTANGSSAMSGSSAPMAAGTAKLDMTDKTFIHGAAIAGLAEVNDGQLAEQKGDDQVKKIGTRMVTDHTKANDQLTQISQMLGDPAPSETDAMHKAMSKSLEAKSGYSFDTAYLKTELLGHEKTIALFKKEISGGSNSQLKSFAQTTLPVLEDHLSMIKSAQQS